MKGYVVYKDRRFRVVNTCISGEGEMAFALLRLKPFKGPDIMAPEAECVPWKRGTVRHVNGTHIHRDKRPVRLDIDTGTEIIKARLKGKRKSFSCTFGGLYDLLARQSAINAKRDRAFARRTGRK